MSSCQATGWEGGWLGDQEIGACQEEHNWSQKPESTIKTIKSEFFMLQGKSFMLYLPVKEKSQWI